MQNIILKIDNKSVKAKIGKFTFRNQIKFDFIHFLLFFKRVSGVIKASEMSWRLTLDVKPLRMRSTSGLFTDSLIT